MQILTCTELNDAGCSEPNCTHDHSVVYLHPKCHPKAGTWASYDKNTGVLTIECKRCQKPFVGILVTSSPPIGENLTGPHHSQRKFT